MNKDKSFQEIIDYNSYKFPADKIRQKLDEIRNNPNLSARRWVWELMQNAKDVHNKFERVSIEIELGTDRKLYFRHNGNPFKKENLISLIQQISSKDSTNANDETGKFGTGFICTHLLSDKIEIKGIVSYNDLNRGFSLVLDRSGNSTEELITRISKSLKNIVRLDDIGANDDKEFPLKYDYEKKRKESDFDTIFIYDLNTQERIKYAKEGLEDLIHTLPVTLVTMPVIKQVRVINKLEKTDKTYSCISDRLDNQVSESVVNVGNDKKIFLTYNNNNKITLTAEVYKENNLFYIKERDKQQPVIYRDFPLIGSEKFYFPFILNGYNFEPSEDRAGLYLNGNDNIKADTNRNIIESAIETVILFDKWLVEHHVHNLYLASQSRMPEPNVIFDEFAEKWIKNLQIGWRNQLADLRLVETDSNINISIDELKVPIFSSASKNSSNDKFYQLLNQGLLNSVLPKSSHLQGWIEVVKYQTDTWNRKLVYNKTDFLTDLMECKTLLQLSEKTGMANDKLLLWLNEVYKFLFEEKEVECFSKYAILPNKNGEFCLLDDIQTDQTKPIPEILITIYDHVTDGPQANDFLLNHEINASLWGSQMKNFDSDEMVKDLNSKIKNADDDTTKKYIVTKLISLYPKDAKQDVIEYRKAIYDFTASHLQLEEFSSIEGVSEELWKQTDIYWFNNSINEVEKSKDIETFCKTYFIEDFDFQNALNWLDKYFRFYRNYTNGELLHKTSVFPNQLGDFCLLDDLHYDCNIPEKIKEIAEVGNNEDCIREILLDKSIRGYSNQSPYKVSNIYEVIKNTFDNTNDENRYRIAAMSLAIIPADNEADEYKRVYNFVTSVCDEIPDSQLTNNTEGYKWHFAQKMLLGITCKKIARSESIDGLRDNYHFFENKSDNEIIEWVDSLITFLKGKDSFWSIITDKDRGYGIWINQNNDFCMYNDVRLDNSISEEIKDLALNPCVHFDARESLLNKHSVVGEYLATEPMNETEIGKRIDTALANYNGNRQEKNFSKLVFDIGRLLKDCKNKDLENSMVYYNSEKNSLIVQTLENGETMNLVGELIQQGDEKLRFAKDLLNNHTEEELDAVQNFLQSPSNILLPKDIREKYPDLHITLERIEEWLSLEMRLDQNDMRERTQEEKKFDEDTGHIGEEYVYNYLNDNTELKDIKWRNKIAESGSPFDIEATTAKEGKVYIEVKSTTTSISDANTISLIISSNEWSFANDANDNKRYYLARVFNVRRNPKVYFLRIGNAL